MKKILLMAALSILLVGCNNDGEVELTVHADIDDDMARDSYQVMRKVETGIEKDEKPDMGFLLDYTDKYLTGFNNGDLDLTNEEMELALITSLMVMKVDEYFTIGSEQRNFEKDKETFFEVLRTGVYKKGAMEDD